MYTDMTSGYDWMKYFYRAIFTYFNQTKLDHRGKIKQRKSYSTYEMFKKSLRLTKKYYLSEYIS